MDFSNVGECMGDFEGLSWKVVGFELGLEFMVLPVAFISQAWKSGVEKRQRHVTYEDQIISVSTIYTDNTC